MRHPGPSGADLAVLALAYFSEDPERMGDFLAVTGLDPAEVPALAAKGRLTAGVLSYLAADEALLVGFAEDRGLDPAEVGGIIQRTVGFEF